MGILVAGCVSTVQINPRSENTSFEVHIHDIQGAALTSPMDGERVQSVGGIVTAFTRDGFYMQDPAPDEDSATSEGIYVFVGNVPKARPGDSVVVDGVVEEWYPGGIESNNQPTTQIKNARVQVIRSSNQLPSAVILGAEGRQPPRIVEDDGGKQFDPEEDALDFYESLESMLVKVDRAVVVGATNTYGETVIVPDELSESGLRSVRGGILLQPNKLNPQRIVLDDSLSPQPAAKSGDRLAEPIVGIMDYSFGNFKVQPVEKTIWQDADL